MRQTGYVVSVAAILAVIVSGSCAATMAPAAPVVTPAGVRFVLMLPEARSVALAGSFNQWSASAHPLMRDGSRGPWTIVLELPPGEHRFMYVVDGAEWMSPPLAEDYADDGFGARNGIVVVHEVQWIHEVQEVCRCRARDVDESRHARPVRGAGRVCG